MLLMESVAQRELDGISGYNRKNYYTKLKKKGSANRNTIIDNGIILIIHNYCKPLVLAQLMLENYLLIPRRN